MYSVVQGSNSPQSTDQRAQLGLFAHRNIPVDIQGNLLHWMHQQFLVNIK